MSFITNFRIEQLPLYQKASKASSQSRELFVREVGNRGQLSYGSLYYKGGGDLTEFWRIFDKLKIEFDKMQANREVDFARWVSQETNTEAA